MGLLGPMPRIGYTWYIYGYHWQSGECIFCKFNLNLHILHIFYIFCIFWYKQIIDTESYRDLQKKLPSIQLVSKLEIRAVGVLSRPYNEGTYGRCAGMARRPLTVWLVSCSNNSIPIWTALFSPVSLLPGQARPNDRVGWHGASARVLILCFAPAI